MAPENKTPEQTPDETVVQVSPQIDYGVSIFMMDNNKPHVEVTGNPSALQLEMLLVPALSNVQGDIIVGKMLTAMQQQMQQHTAARQHKRIITPGTK